MRVYRVQFEGYQHEFHHAATEAQIIEWGFCNSITLNSLSLNDSITLRTIGFKLGWDKYPTVKFTAHECQSYKCNCCLQEVPGDGAYDSCHLCGWENDPGETNNPNKDDGPNHMSLTEGRANFKKHGWYEHVDQKWIK